MSKKKRVYVKRLSADELASMSDDELQSKHNYCIDLLNVGLQNEAEQQAWETELAYIQREILTRKTRYDLHVMYMRNIAEQDREFLRQEASLPVVNFDNFVPGRDNV